MVTHRAKFNSYAEFCYDCLNESRKVIIKKITSCTGNMPWIPTTKVTNASLLLTSCITQTTKKIEYTK